MRSVVVLLLLGVGAAAGPDENLPDDCIIVHHFDFTALRKTEVWGRIAKPIDEFLKEVLGFEGLLEGTGFRTETDLASLTLALGGSVARQHVYAIARGTFDADKFRARLADTGMTATRRDGMTAFRSEEVRMAFGLLDAGNGFLYAEPPEALDALRAAMREGATPSKISKRLAAAPAAHVYSVVLLTQACRDAVRKEPDGAVLAGLESSVAVCQVGTHIEVTGSAKAESEEAAKQLLAAAEEFVAGVGIAKSAKFGRSGAMLNVRVKLPLEEAMTIMGMPVDSVSEPGRSARPVVMGGAPELEGQGRLQCLALPGQVNGMGVSPDGRYLFVDRALESDVVLDADLHVVGKTRDTHGRMGFTADGRAGVWEGWGAEVIVRTIPDLARTARAEAKPDIGGIWALCLMPDGKSFVVVKWKRIERLHMNPLRWGKAGKAAIAQPIAGAIDPGTGMLVMIGDETKFEVFDPTSLESVATATLPHKVTYDIVATAGRAYVGTKAGVILPVDIETRHVLDAVRVAKEGSVSLTLSGTGRTLVAVARGFVRGGPYPTRMVAYAIEDAELREIAAASFLSPGSCNDVALLESKRTVLVGGTRSFVWRYGGEGSD